MSWNEKSVALDYHTYSGDDGASADFEGLRPLYQTGHGILGLADQIGQTNTTDLSLHFKWNQDENSSWGLAYHMFSADQVAAGFDDDLGDEIDLTYSYQYSGDVSFNFGYAAYSAGALPTDATPGISGMDANTMWVTTNVNF